jgi:1,4-dihydroxy-2-naphthoate octaprenyltransferase
MLSKSSWLHLRIPFSWFLLPIFLFSLSISPNLIAGNILWTFVILHFFLYPASNAYNSYFDKDKGSIGILKNPPPVRRELYYLALLFDLIALILGLVFINVEFTIMLLIYGLISKAYSHPSIRLKKYAITAWLVTGIFQGFFTFVMCYIGLNNFTIESAVKSQVILGGTLATIMLWANYPLTQVYQHEEDAARGDRTLSILLGIRGTFLFAGTVFIVVATGFFLYFMTFFKVEYSFGFLLALLPVVAYFVFWLVRVYKNPREADYSKTMWLTTLSATCLNIFFIYFLIDRNYLLQLIQ